MSGTMPHTFGLLVFIGLFQLGLLTYEGYEVHHLIPKHAAHQELLLKLENRLPEVDFWRRSHGIGQPAVVMVPPHMAPPLRKLMILEGVGIKRMHQNVQKLVDEEKERMAEYRRQHPLRPSQMIDFNRYNRYVDVARWLNETAASCGSRCSLESIGNSWEGRPLWLMKISSGQNKPIIFLECGIHAREWIAPAVCVNIINKLISEYNTNTTVSRMVDQYDWYIEPITNPDGYEYSHTTTRLWRKTRRPNTDRGSDCFGTDGNRNFGHMWGLVGASTDPCSNIYMGSQAFSEMETESIRAYVEPLKNRIRAYYAVHSYGQYILIPWGYTPDYPPDYLDLESVAIPGAVAIFNYQGMIYTVGQSTRLLGATAGASDDWAKGSADIKFAYTIELRDTGNYGFELPEDQISDNFNEIFDAFTVMSDELHRRFPML